VLDACAKRHGVETPCVRGVAELERREAIGRTNEGQRIERDGREHERRLVVEGRDEIDLRLAPYVPVRAWQPRGAVLKGNLDPNASRSEA
jgi:hypothetical protein